MGTVYLSDDEMARVRVALKANRKGLSDGKVRDEMNKILQKLR